VSTTTSKAFFVVSAALLLGAPAVKAAGALSTAPTRTLPAATAGKAMATIGAVDGESDEAMSLFNVRFDKKPAWTKLSDLQEHGTFLQLVLPNTVVPNPGEFFEGNSPYVQKIAAFQLTPSSAGVRFFTSESAAKTKQAATVEVLGKRVVVTVDHAQMKKLLAAKPTVKTVKAGTTRTITEAASPDAVIAEANAPATDIGDEANAAKPAADSDFAAVYKPAVETPANAALEANAPAETEAAVEGAVAETTGTAASDAAPGAAGKTETPIGQDEIPALDPQATAAAAKVAADVIANTEVRRDIPEPAALIKSEPAPGTDTALTAPSTEKGTGGVMSAAPASAAPQSAARFGSDAPDLRGRLVQVSIFSGVMLLLLLVLWLVRPYLRKRAQALGAEPMISMKTLASLPLAAKQKVSLIQVGDERILIGVTPENVTFITTIKNERAGGRSSPVGNQIAQQLGQGGSFAKFLSEPEVDAFEMKPLPFNSQPQPAQQPQQSGSAPAPERRTAAPTPQQPVKTRQAIPPQPVQAARKALVQNPVGAHVAAATEAAPRAPARHPQSRIAISIGEDGITDHRSAQRPRPSTPAADEQGGQKAIEDVTKMIREKLKNLRTI
jgi:flagellar protein FliO/FliZ